MYSKIFGMLLYLRQLTAHSFLLQECMGDLFELEDIDNLCAATASETSTTVEPSNKDVLTYLRKVIDEQQRSDANQVEIDQDLSTFPADDVLHPSEPIVFKFCKLLRQLAESSKWEDLARRSLCHKCGDAPVDPQVTDCLHLYCGECLKAVALEAAQDGEDPKSCLECGKVYSVVRPCSGFKELDYAGKPPRAAIQTASVSTTDPPRQEKGNTKRIDMRDDGSILPSAKTTALVLQIEDWLRQDPKAKIIVFTQWPTMIEIVKRQCEQQEWGCCTVSQPNCDVEMYAYSLSSFTLNRNKTRATKSSKIFVRRRISKLWWQV
jgi:hypothetical protein